MAASKWAWRAGELFDKSPRGEVCRHRIAQLGLEMLLAGEKFTVVTGTKDRDSNRHTWIEYDNNGEPEILEPMAQRSQEKNFPYTDRLKVNDGSDTDDLAFMNRIQRMYQEVDKTLPDQFTQLYETKHMAYLQKFWPGK